MTACSKQCNVDPIKDLVKSKESKLGNPISSPRQIPGEYTLDTLLMRHALCPPYTVQYGLELKAAPKSVIKIECITTSLFCSGFKLLLGSSPALQEHDLHYYSALESAAQKSLTVEESCIGDRGPSAKDRASLLWLLSASKSHVWRLRLESF